MYMFQQLRKVKGKTTKKFIFLLSQFSKETAVFISFIFFIQAVYMCTFHCSEFQVETTGHQAKMTYLYYIAVLLAFVILCNNYN